MGLFGKSKKDKVDNAVLLIDKSRRKYSKVRDAYVNRTSNDLNFDPAMNALEIQELLNAMLRDLYNIRRHLTSGNSSAGMENYK